MAVADSPERRLTIDDLCADPSELQIFVSLFLKHAERDAPRLGSYTVDTAAKELSEVLLERSGGILGLLVAIFKGIFLEHKIFKDKPFDAATLREYTLSPTLFNFVAGTRFTVKLDKEQSKALSQFMAHGKSMTPTCIESMRKKALIKTNAAGDVTIWSQLVFDVLWHKLFEAKGHPHCPFTNIDTLVEFIVDKLKGDFREWVLHANGRFKHEDEINAAIAAMVKAHLPPGARHAGPAKLSTKMGYSQVDHAVWDWPTKGNVVLIEPCVGSGTVKEHCDRFGATGRYQHYNFHQAIVLWLSTAKNPSTSVVIDMAKVSVYHVSVPDFSVKKWKGGAFAPC